MNVSLKRFAMVVVAASLPALALAQPATQTAPTPVPTPGTTTSSVQSFDPMSRRASRIIGADIVNEENRTIGEVHDLMISPAGGPITAVLSVGGFLGIGERYVAVPLSNLQWNADRRRWTLPGATVDSLRARPVYEYPDRS